LKTGLALSGGAMRGLAHIGVLKYLKEQNIKVDIIAGTSAGALIGAFYAAGKTPEEMEEIALNLHRRELLKYIYRSPFPRKGLINTAFIGSFLEKHLGPINFSDLKIPLLTVAVDIIHDELVYCDSGPLAPAVMSSCAIPGIFTPVEHQEKTLVDGGVLENVPVPALQKKKVRNIIAVDLSVYTPSAEKPENIFDIIFKTLYLMSRNLEEKHCQKARYYITPDLKKIGTWDLEKAEETINLGYTAAKKTWEEKKDTSIFKKAWRKKTP